MLRDVVRKGVQDAVLRGKGADILIKQLQKEFKTSYNYARRLAVTETARVYSEAQKANYNANDIEEYQVLAEAGACNICAPFDGEHFKTSEMVAGSNAAPFHPHCRCTTAPYSERVKMWEKIEGEGASLEQFKDEMSEFWRSDSASFVSKYDYYNIGKLTNNPVLGSLAGENIRFEKRSLERILDKHGQEFSLDEMLLIIDAVEKPNVIADNSKHHDGSFLLYASIPNRKNRFMETVVIPDGNGGFIIHYHKLGKSKINKLEREGVILYSELDM
ncbi:Phage protein [Streptococcus sp. DD10]|nr:Phage protein [Streptococcus sp. DD10]